MLTLWLPRCVVAAVLVVVLSACVVEVPAVTLTYDANGGVGAVPVDGNAYVVGDVVTVAGAAGLSRDGFSFGGWNTAADGAGSQHPVGGSLVVGAADVTLYAVWRPRVGITSAGGHNVALLGDGRLLTWGWNSFGQLGDGTLTDRSTAFIVPAFPPAERSVTTVIAGSLHTLALLDDGRLFAWGGNTYGQLGDGTTTRRTSPTIVPDFPPMGSAISLLAAGERHTAAVLSDGSLYTWGDNLFGQLGNGSEGEGTSANRPTLVPHFPPAGSTITTVAAGQFFNAAVLSDGSLYAWGANEFGQIGDGTTNPRPSPTLVADFPPAGTTITSVALGLHHSAALLSDGSLYMWGRNSFGQLGDGTTEQRNRPTRVPAFPPAGTTVSAIALGAYHTLALLDEGRRYAWGWNVEGELGDGTIAQRNSPTLVPAFGAGGVGIAAVTAAFSHSVALLSDGSLYSWGRNNESQLGHGPDGNPTYVATPTAVVGPARVTTLGRE